MFPARVGHPARARNLLAEYGEEVWTSQGARRYLRLGSPRKIPTAGGYVAAVRRLTCRRGAPASWRDLPDGAAGGVDGRLIAALHNLCPPRAWLPGGRAEAWLAYWEATQTRPGVVGSDHNDLPEAAARAWRLGLPAGAYPRGLAHLLPERWRGGHRRVRAVLRLARLARPGGQAPATVGDGLPAGLRTADLRRLSRLSGAALRALLGRSLPVVHGRVVWAAVATALLDLPRGPARAALEDLRVPAADWLAEPVLRGAALPAVAAWCLAHRPVGERCAARRGSPALVAEIDRLDQLARAAAEARALRAAAREAARLARRRALRAADGRLVGWRGWGLAGDGRTLVSPVQRTIWDTRVFRAASMAAGPGVRTVPGIHAAWDRRGDVIGEVLGRVLASGRVVSGPEGWRAEVVEIDRLLVPAGTPAVVVGLLRARYGVPVGVAREGRR